MPVKPKIKKTKPKENKTARKTPSVTRPLVLSQVRNILAASEDLPPDSLAILAAIFLHHAGITLPVLERFLLTLSLYGARQEFCATLAAINTALSEALVDAAGRLEVSYGD